MITNKFLALDDEEIVFIKDEWIELKNFKNETKNIKFHKIDWEIEDAELGSFEDFMLKEIYEIPKAIRNTLRGRVEKVNVSLGIETIDTLEAVKEAKRKGALTLGIINIPGSTIARTVDSVIYTYAGPERVVASTKAYYSQITALFLLLIFISKIKNLSSNEANDLVEEVIRIPEKTKEILKDVDKIKNIAKRRRIKSKRRETNFNKWWKYMKNF